MSQFFPEMPVRAVPLKPVKKKGFAPVLGRRKLWCSACSHWSIFTGVPGWASFFTANFGGVGMRRHLFGAAVFLLLACLTAFGQQTKGTITGRVVDQQGAAIPGATVTVKNVATGFTRTETSDAEGLYRIGALPVGTYEVNAELQGFATVSKKDGEVNVAQGQAIDFSMKVGSGAG